MGNLLETIYDLLVKPREAFAEILATKTLRDAMKIFGLSVVLAGFGMCAGSVQGGMKLLVVLLQVMGSVAVWFFSTAVWHLLAELLGGCGSAKKLLTVTGFVYFLQIMILPVYLLAVFMPGDGVVLISIATLFIGAWTLWLQLLAIRSVYDFSLARACLVVGMPFLVMMVIVGILIFTVGSVFLSSLFGVVAPLQF